MAFEYLYCNMMNQSKQTIYTIKKLFNRKLIIIANKALSWFNLKNFQLEFIFEN